MENNTQTQDFATSYKGALSDPALRAEARRLWKEAAHRKELTAASCAAYQLLLGGKLDEAFSPITNGNKLSNGACADGAKQDAITSVIRLRREAFLPWESLLQDFYKETKYGCLPDSSKEHPLVFAAYQEAKSL